MSVRRGLLVLTAALSVAATSEDLADPNLTDTLRAADAIAWVRILDKTPVTFESDGRTQTCGYNYNARVVEKIKGGDGALSFFSDHDQLADHAGSDYFVIVFPRRPDATTIDAASEGPGRERAKCMLDANPRFVRGAYPGMMIPREDELSTRWGATLFRRDASNLLWSDEFHHRDFQDGDRMHSAASWEAINEAFERAER